MKSLRWLAPIVSSMLALLSGGPVSAQAPTRNTLHDAAMGKLKPAELPVTFNLLTNAPLTKKMPFISNGTIVAVRQALEAAEKGATDAAPNSHAFRSVNIGQAPETLGCSDRLGTHDGNTRVNQDCTYRRQAEEKIVFNPANHDNLLAGANDSRVGYNQCSIAWSTDGGGTWGDLLPPFRQRLNDPSSLLPTASDPNSHTITGQPGTFHTYDAGSDPAPSFDSQGRGLFGCVTFDVASNANMVYGVPSPLGAQGSFFLNIDSPPARSFIVVEDNDPNIVHDKPFNTADIFPGSPNRDNLYTTWTIFKFGCPPNAGFCSSPIYGSMSTDHGVHWSTPEEISGASPLCFFGNAFDPTRPADACDFDQGSDPVVLPNGDLAVIFNNGNTAANNPNSQQLAVHCHPSGSSPAGSAHLNCGTPTKVGDDITVGEPLCDFGRGPEECVPGPFIRTDDFPRVAINRETGRLFAVWQDYRHQEYDVQLASSTDGGSTWAQMGTVNPDSGLDHYFPAVDVVARPSQGFDHVGVSYFRSARVPNETQTPAGVFALGEPGIQNENSDYVVAGGTVPFTPFNFEVVSPVFPPPDGIQAGFNGDYSGLTIVDDLAHPIWSDTRNVDPFAPADEVVHDEDVFTTKIAVPNGMAKPSVGKIGAD